MIKYILKVSYTGRIRENNFFLKMPQIKYIGKDINHYGKTLWEIVGNLRDYGVGRLITRGRYLDYQEPCFLKIIKVVPQPSIPNPSYDDRRKTIVWVEKTFRGIKRPELLEILSVSYKCDYQLILKEDEHIWYQRAAECTRKKQKTISPKLNLPPLLKLLIKAEKEKNGENPTDEDLMIPIRFKQGFENIVTIANDGEEPDIKCNDSFGEVLAPSLYENIEATREYFTKERKFIQGEERL